MTSVFEAVGGKAIGYVSGGPLLKLLANQLLLN
jgi:hypothetical protein